MPPDIVLHKGQILLTQTSSSLAIQTDNTAFFYGLVALINDLSEMYVVGDSVLFDPTGATILKYSTVDYYLTTENKVYFKEVLPP